MVVLLIDLNGVFARKGKCGSPVAADGDGPSPFESSFQRMQPQTRQVHILGRYRCGQTAQHQPEPLGMLGPDTSLRTRQKEPLKTTMAETGDDPGSVTPRVTMSSLLTAEFSARQSADTSRPRPCTLRFTDCCNELLGASFRWNPSAVEEVDAPHAHLLAKYCRL